MKSTKTVAFSYTLIIIAAFYFQHDVGCGIVNAQTAYNPLAAPPKNSTNNTVHNKTGSLYANISEECNFFTKLNTVVAPWPKNCKVYQYDNGCNKYEISKDGKSVDSC